MRNSNILIICSPCRNFSSCGDCAVCCSCSCCSCSSCSSCPSPNRSGTSSPPHPVEQQHLDNTPHSFYLLFYQSLSETVSLNKKVWFLPICAQVRYAYKKWAGWIYTYFFMNKRHHENFITISNQKQRVDKKKIHTVFISHDLLWWAYGLHIRSTVWSAVKV